MENASKALIIAGAILISILLIAVSMYIYNASQDTIKGAGSSMDQQAKNMYNANMESYLGTNKKGSEIKSLIQAVIDSNNQYAGESGKFVQIVASGIGSSLDGEIGDAGESDNSDDYVSEKVATMSKLKSAINTGKKYTAEATYSAGIITSISITCE